MKLLQDRPTWLAPTIVGVAILIVILISVGVRHGPAPVDVTSVTVTSGEIVNRLPENGTLSLPQTATIAARTGSTVVE